MVRISALTSFRGNDNDVNPHQSKHKPKYEYPLTFDEFKKDQIVSKSLAGIFLGGITGGLIKTKYSTRAAILGGTAMLGFCLVSTAANFYTGAAKVNYLEKKQKFENLSADKNKV